MKVICGTRTKKTPLDEGCEVGALAFNSDHRQHSPSAYAAVHLALDSRGQFHKLHRLTAFSQIANYYYLTILSSTAILHNKIL